MEIGEIVRMVNKVKKFEYLVSFSPFNKASNTVVFDISYDWFFLRIVIIGVCVGSQAMMLM